jgi:hypothetical protein
VSPPLSIHGLRFGKLVAVEELPRKDGKRVWRLACDCGGEIVAFQKKFASGGKLRSCGCAAKVVTHGLSRIPEYRHWVNMVSRCENPDATGFEHYGGRGIVVCRPWRADFQNFYRDMGPRPSPKHSIDRIDVNGNYEPANCRWATSKEQGRNTRANHMVEVDGRSIPLVEAAEGAPVGYNTILYRIKRGWRLEDALGRPQQKGVRP